MPDKTKPSEMSKIVSDETDLTLDELCHTCGLSKEHIRSYIDEGIVAPAEASSTQWRFSEVTVITIHRAKRLERDLKLNPPGIALALDLMQRIERLEARLSRLEPPEGRKGGSSR